MVTAEPLAETGFAVDQEPWDTGYGGPRTVDWAIPPWRQGVVLSGVTPGLIR